MKEITIDCAALNTSQLMHLALAEAFAFPDWYGHNLDALHDLLTSITEDTRLTLLNFENSGSFSRGFRRVFLDAAEENPHFEILTQ